MIRAVIFDLDGVLVHTDQFHYIAWKALADELAIPFNETCNQRLRGLSRMDSLEHILKNSRQAYSAEQKIHLAERKNDTYKALIARMTPADVTQEVLNTLDSLKQKGLRLGVGSSSKNARFILERTGVYSYFDAVVDGTMITKAKPNPEVFFKAATLLGVTPKDAAVVEDAHAGIAAAKTGGFIALAIGEAVSSELADVSLSHFSDIPTCLARFN
ncbi:beta-phosphoglucomutase [Oscillospiraceae bacterium LTW-04]|nr:beta-phosphoglucomutase [Oscillospiraceae bacterium MB24-C1]